MFDSPVMVKLSALAECLCAQIAKDGLPGLCFCGLVPGETPAADYVDNCENDLCGMAWVRLAALAPITGINIPNLTVNNCNSSLGFDAEIGIMRCAALPDEDGNPPPADELLAEADLQIAEATAMWRAMQCCPELEEFIIETYTPIGPQGGVVGGYWTLTAGL